MTMMEATTARLIMANEVASAGTLWGEEGLVTTTTFCVFWQLLQFFIASRWIDGHRRG